MHDNSVGAYLQNAGEKGETGHLSARPSEPEPAIMWEDQQMGSTKASEEIKGKGPFPKKKICESNDDDKRTVRCNL